MQLPLQIPQQILKDFARPPQDHAKICHHLIIAGSRGVQSSRRIPNQGFQAGFDIHVNIFQLAPKGEASLRNFHHNGVHALADGLIILGRKDTAIPQHLSMGEGGLNILIHHLFIHIQRYVDILEQFRRCCRKSPPPDAGGFGMHGLGRGGESHDISFGKKQKWSEREDSNLRPPVPQTGALTRLRYAPSPVPYKQQQKLSTEKCHYRNR